MSKKYNLFEPKPPFHDVVAAPPDEFFTLDLPDVSNFLIISDTHFPHTNMEETFKRFSSLITNHEPDIVIHLGDVFDWYCVEDKELVLKSLAKFVELCSVPFYILPGNHDRELFQFFTAEIEKLFPPKRIIVLNGFLFIRIPSGGDSQTCPPMYLSHDAGAGNNYKLCYHEKLPYMKHVKQVNKLPPNAILLFGHMHVLIESPENSLLSISCFHPAKQFSYSCISRKDGTFEIKNCNA